MESILDCCAFGPGYDGLTCDSPMTVWRDRLSTYTEPRLSRSLLDVVTSLGAYLVLIVLTYLSISTSPLLALAIAPLTAGFQVRTFIVFHDCAHSSFFASRRANAVLCQRGT